MRMIHLLLAIGATASRPLIAGPPAAANSAFDAYVRTVESCLAEQHRSRDHFLAAPAAATSDGEVNIERLPGPDLSGAMLHHWRGTAFVPHAHAAGFDRLLRDFDSYPRVFSPQVVRANAVSHGKDSVEVRMRVRQHHVITVTMDAVYDVTFGRLDTRHAYSASRSTRISEIDSPGTSAERALSPGEEHGFLWRLNTYWTYQERDAGLDLQIETVSLSRSIPRGLGWMIRPWVERVPRESLEFTLRAARNALLQQGER